MPSEVPLRPLLTQGEVAHVLRVSQRTVRRIVERGALRPVLVVRQSRYHPDDVERLIATDRSGRG